MTITKPYFCRVEYWTPTGWSLGHAGINLVDPARYAVRLTRPGRVTVLDTGEVFFPECGVCAATTHPEGMCLI